MEINGKSRGNWGDDGEFLSPQIIGGETLQIETLTRYFVFKHNTDHKSAHRLARVWVNNFYEHIRTLDRRVK